MLAVNQLSGYTISVRNGLIRCDLQQLFLRALRIFTAVKQSLKRRGAELGASKISYEELAKPVSERTIQKIHKSAEKDGI